MAKGFNRPVGGRNQGGGMMQQLRRLQEQMEQMQAQLAEAPVPAPVDDAMRGFGGELIADIAEEHQVGG